MQNYMLLDEIQSIVKGFFSEQYYLFLVEFGWHREEY